MGNQCKNQKGHQTVAAILFISLPCLPMIPREARTPLLIRGRKIHDMSLNELLLWKGMISDERKIQFQYIAELSLLLDSA